MAIKLTYRGETPLPVEVEGLTPDWACDKSLAEIERFEIFHGNRKLPLAELFTVAGDPTDKRFDFEGNLSGVHWIGAHMRSGVIAVHGPGGRHLGSEMRGGEIRVEGDAGGWLGCEMRGGLIHVHGNAGDLVGAAYRGSVKGMTGGTIFVASNAGSEVALAMHQGLIAIGGDADDMLGFNMKDGTVLVAGRCGARPGAALHGGTIGLFGSPPPNLLPGFRFDRTASLAPFEPVLSQLRALQVPIDKLQLPIEADVYIGDLVESGEGEIHVRHADRS